MSTENKPVLTPKLIDTIIRETASDKTLSKEAINKKAGIPKGGSREDKLLKPWIKIQENTLLVFGEQITWRKEKFISKRGADIFPDYMGTDTNGRPVILELKFKFNFPDDRGQLRTDGEHDAIGQILQYACVYRRMNPASEIPRLFIVSIDFSPDVDAVCEFLRLKGIPICYIAIERKLEK